MPDLHRRILIAELDSVANRRLYEDFGDSPAVVESRLVGALRVAHLVGGEILLTDSMLFDSRFFSGLEPNDLGALLGGSPHRLPLTVLHAENTLAEALEAKLQKGRAFRWQLAGADQGADWASPGLRRSWDRWITAAERGQITTEPMLTRHDGSPKPLFHVDVDTSSASTSELVIALRAAAERNDRSGVFEAYHAGVVAGADGETIAELVRLRDAYNVAYFDAMAAQHDAEWVSFSDRGQDSARTADREMFRISGQLVETAVSAPPAIFSQIMFATGDERDAFFERRTRRRLLALAYRAEKATSSEGLSEVLTKVVRSITFALLAVVVAVPGLDEAAGWLPWAIFAVGAVLVVPWDVVGTVRDLRPSRLDATLSVGSR